MINFFQKYYNLIYRILLFAISIVLIVYLFPKEGKFKYEFQQGKPWLHEDLIAPYDFTIYKLESEIKDEKDSILTSFRPYYKFDTTIYHRQKRNFEVFVRLTWQEFQQTNDSIFNQFEHSKKYFFYQSPQDYINSIKQVLAFIYKKGILEFNEDETNIPGIVIINDSFAEEYDLDEIFTLKTGYKYLQDKTNGIIPPSEDSIVQKLQHDFINKLQLNQFIRANLFYDESTSQKVKQNLINNISLTRGVVQKDEGIILKGEIVDRDTYRILESLRREYETSLGDSNNYSLIFVGQLLFVFITFFTLYVFLLSFRKDILESPLKTSFIFVLIILIVLTASLIIRYNVVSLYLIPFAILPIIIKTFYDSRLALFVHIITIMIVGFIAPNGFEFVFIQFIAGVIAIYTMKNMYRRGILFATAMAIIVSYCLTYFSIAIIQEGDITQIEWINFVWFTGNGLLLLASYPLIYIFEKLFGFLSDVTLIELSDLNQPLLRELAEKAPGSFQHSIQVANIAEEVIQQIGGDSLLVRAGALYHDIGKKEHPLYFIENQSYGINPHDKLDYDVSAKMIISHVLKGIEIAKKRKLPEEVIDFIRSHHGNTRVEYFYRMFKQKYPDKNIEEKKFTYPGPAPNSKEIAVVMMADAIEAASRSLKTINEQTISEMVDNIINFQISMEQFDTSNLTFNDIRTVKEIFKRKIKNIFHSRIEYPAEE